MKRAMTAADRLFWRMAVGAMERLANSPCHRQAGKQGPRRPTANNPRGERGPVSRLGTCGEGRNLDSRLSSRIGQPGLMQTLAIRGLFETHEHFVAWLDDFNRGGGQERIKAPNLDGYWFYLADAKINAGRILRELRGNPDPLEQYQREKRN